MEWVDARGRHCARLCAAERQGHEAVTLRALGTSGDPLPEQGIEVYLRVGRGRLAVPGVARVLSGDSGPLVAVTRPDPESRRALHRVDVDLPAQTSAGFARVINLSGGGCLLVPDNAELPDVGTPLGLTVRPPTCAAPLHLRAVVLRHVLPEFRRPRLAIEFLDVGQPTQDQLVRYVFLRQQELLRMGLVTPASGQQA